MIDLAAYHLVFSFGLFLLSWAEALGGIWSYLPGLVGHYEHGDITGVLYLLFSS